MKTNIVASAYLSYSSKTKVKFHENIQFSVAPKFVKHDEFVFYIKDMKSNNFEITRIVNQNLDSHFDKANNCFENRHRNVGDSDWFTFHICADVEFKKVASVDYEIKIPAARMKFLEVYEYFEDLIILPGYEKLTFKYFVKKVSVDFVEVYVENGHNVKIEGEYQDFSINAPVKDDINLTLSFIFDPENLEIPTNDSFDLDNVS